MHWAKYKTVLIEGTVNRSDIRAWATKHEGTQVRLYVDNGKRYIKLAKMMDQTPLKKYYPCIALLKVQGVFDMDTGIIYEVNLIINEEL